MSAVGRFGGEAAGAGRGDHTMSPLRPLLVTLLLGSAAGLTGTMTAAPALTGSSTSVSLHGTYQIVTADLVGSHGEYIGERYRPVLQVGSVTYPLRLPPRVRLRGAAGITVIGSISAGTVTASSVQSAPASTAPAVATSGVSTSVLVILAEWQGPDRMTTATARRVMFTDGAQWYSEVSNGAVTQHGDVTPWVHITGPPDGQCFAGGPTILSQAEAAAGHGAANGRRERRPRAPRGQGADSPAARSASGRRAGAARHDPRGPHPGGRNDQVRSELAGTGGLPPQRRWRHRRRRRGLDLLRPAGGRRLHRGRAQRARGVPPVDRNLVDPRPAPGDVRRHGGCSGAGRLRRGRPGGSGRVAT